MTKVLSITGKITFAIVSVAFSRTAVAAIPLTGPHENGDDVLALRIESYRVDNGTVETALRLLRAENPRNIVIGLEKVPRSSDRPEPRFSLFLSSATVGQVLTAICEQDRRYKYELIHTRLIHVFPVDGKSDPSGLLDIRVTSFSFDGKKAPSALIERIALLAPELRAFLAQRRMAYYANRGITPGSPGADVSGNMDPEIHLHLSNRSVREILNQIVLNSIEVSRKSKPDIGGNTAPPTSWIYEFMVDPNASTGLGGTPLWSAF